MLHTLILCNPAPEEILSFHEERHNQLMKRIDEKLLSKELIPNSAE